MSEPDTHPSVGLLETLAQQLPFQTMRDPLLLFGAFFLLTLVVIIAGQSLVKRAAICRCTGYFCRHSGRLCFFANAPVATDGSIGSGKIAAHPA